MVSGFLADVHTIFCLVSGFLTGVQTIGAIYLLSGFRFPDRCTGDGGGGTGQPAPVLPAAADRVPSEQGHQETTGPYPRQPPRVLPLRSVITAGSWFKQDFIPDKIKIQSEGMVMGSSTSFLLIGGELIYMQLKRRKTQMYGGRKISPKITINET